MSRLVEGQTGSIKLQEQVDENIPPENALPLAGCTGLQNKMKAPQERVKCSRNTQPTQTQREPQAAEVAVQMCKSCLTEQGRDPGSSTEPLLPAQPFRTTLSTAAD